MQGFWHVFIVEGIVFSERDVIFRLFRWFLRLIQIALYMVQERH